MGFLLSDLAARLKKIAEVIPLLGGAAGAPGPAPRPEKPADAEAPPEAGKAPVLKGHPIMDEMEIQLRIHRIASAHGLDPLLIEAVVRAESEFDPLAVSPRGAMGLMQITRQTAEYLGIENPMNVEDNLEGGMKYLKELLALYSGNLALALAAYNAGPSAVKRHKGIPPYPETRRYVRKVITGYKKLTQQAQINY